MVAADGAVRQVADDIDFPNGMVITPDGSTLVVAESMKGRLTAFTITADGSLIDRRIWADHVAPDGICVDAEGAIWCGAGDVSPRAGQGTSPPGVAVRVRDGGQILDRIELDRPGFSYALGGPTGTTLFIVGQHWRASTKSMRSSRSGPGKPSASTSLRRRRRPQRDSRPPTPVMTSATRSRFMSAVRRVHSPRRCASAGPRDGGHGY